MLAERALRVAVRVINHLLGDEDWARERLRRFAGQRARIELGAFRLPLLIGGDGLFSVDVDASALPDVTISLAPGAPLRTLTESASLLTAAKISGSAELAENLGFIFRNLRWDAEEDLSFFVGDIAARRLVTGGKRVFDWQRQQAKNLALNVAEYLTEEQPSVVNSRQFSAFGSEVAELVGALARLEQRVAAIEAPAKRTPL